VPIERHALRRRPVAVGEARGRADVLDARRPRVEVGLVVLRAERLEPEPIADEGGRGLEVGRDERCFGHGPGTYRPRLATRPWWRCGDTGGPASRRGPAQVRVSGTGAG